jgi:hypothetical protein
MTGEMTGQPSIAGLERYFVLVFLEHLEKSGKAAVTAFAFAMHASPLFIGRFG